MDTFPRRRSEPRELTLGALAKHLDLGLPETGADLVIRGVAPLADAQADDLGLLADGRYLRDVSSSGAGALLVAASLGERITDDIRPRLMVSDAHAALAAALEALYPEIEIEPEIHPTAVLGRDVRLGSRVRVGPYVVIESGARIGDGATLGAHVVVGAEAHVGSGSVLHPHAVVYPRVQLGDRVVLHAGTCVGVDGFGYAAGNGGPVKVPQIGGCVIENDVEIGANTTVDRGSIGATRVGAAAKIDNLVQLAHNVSVGPGSMLAAQVGVAGSSRLGAGVMMGGQVGVAGHLTVGDRVQVTAQAGISKDVPDGETVSGYPARPRRAHLRREASLSQVPDLVRRVRALERGQVLD